MSTVLLSTLSNNPHMVVTQTPYCQQLMVVNSSSVPLGRIVCSIQKQTLNYKLSNIDNIYISSTTYIYHHHLIIGIITSSSHHHHHHHNHHYYHHHLHLHHHIKPSKTLNIFGFIKILFFCC